MTSWWKENTACYQRKSLAVHKPVACAGGSAGQSSSSVVMMPQTQTKTGGLMNPTRYFCACQIFHSRRSAASVQKALVRQRLLAAEEQTREPPRRTPSPWRGGPKASHEDCSLHGGSRNRPILKVQERALSFRPPAGRSSRQTGTGRAAHVCVTGI